MIDSSNRTKISLVIKLVTFTSRRTIASNVDSLRDLHYI